MSQYYVAHLDGSYRVYRLVGLTRQYIGPRSATPREAGAWADLFASTDRISPLRESAEPSTAAGVTPLPRAGRVEGSADVPRGSSTGDLPER